MPINDRLILLDLDGTLLPDNIYKPQADALTFTVRQVGGIDPMPETVDWVGKTDLQLAREMMSNAGVEFNPLRTRYLVEYHRNFQRYCPEIVKSRNGWLPVLAELQEAGALLAVVTGNTLDVAVMKLQRSLLLPFINLSFSAFGSDSEQRSELVSLALDKADRWDDAEAILVGDTPRDIEAARAAGIGAVGLVTPKHDEEALKDADHLVVAPHDLLDLVMPGSMA